MKKTKTQSPIRSFPIISLSFFIVALSLLSQYAHDLTRRKTLYKYQAANTPSQRLERVIQSMLGIPRYAEPENVRDWTKTKSSDWRNLLIRYIYLVFIFIALSIIEICAGKIVIIVFLVLSFFLYMVLETSDEICFQKKEEDLILYSRNFINSYMLTASLTLSIIVLNIKETSSTLIRSYKTLGIMYLAFVLVLNVIQAIENKSPLVFFMYQFLTIIYTVMIASLLFKNRIRFQTPVKK